MKAALLILLLISVSGCFNKDEEKDVVQEFWEMELPQTKPIDDQTKSEAFVLLAEMTVMKDIGDFAKVKPLASVQSGPDTIEAEILKTCSIFADASEHPNTKVQTSRTWSENADSQTCGFSFESNMVSTPKGLSTGTRYDIVADTNFNVVSGSSLDALTEVISASFNTTGFVSIAGVSANAANRASATNITGSYHHESHGLVQIFYKSRSRFRIVSQSGEDDSISGKAVEAYGVLWPSGWVVLYIEANYPEGGGEPTQVMRINGETVNTLGSSSLNQLQRVKANLLAR